MNVKNTKGFTLIELMIVIAIIAILAAIALPAYQDYIARAQMSEAMVLASGIKVPVTEVYSSGGNCPANGSNGIAAATAITGKYVAQVATAGTGSATGGCTITATMKSTDVSTGVKGATLVLTMATTSAAGSFTWTCTSSAKQKYLPTGCTGT